MHKLNPSECPMCQSKAVGMKATRDFHVRTDVHARDLAVQFNITEDQVMDHINNHVLVVSVDEGIDGKAKKNISSPDFYLDELSILYTGIKDCYEWINRDNENGYDVIKVDQLVKLSSEILKILSKMAEFQGRLKGPGDIQSKVLQVEGNLNLIFNILSSGILCPCCEEKVMAELGKIEHLLE